MSGSFFRRFTPPPFDPLAQPNEGGGSFFESPLSGRFGTVYRDEGAPFREGFTSREPIEPPAVIAITQADLLRLVGQKNVSSKGAQKAVFDMLVNDTPSALWFHEISKSGLRLAHFLAQCCVESMGFMSLTESFVYTDAERIVGVFKERITLEEAAAFVWTDEKERHAAIDLAIDEEVKAEKLKKEDVAKERAKRRQASNQENASRGARLANKVYGGRMGNGDAASGDGYRYRGRGLIQLTGRNNYRKAGEALDQPLEAKPELAAEPLLALHTAVWYWTANNLNTLADLDDAVKVSKAVNLGDPNSQKAPNHLEDRKAKTKLAREIWVK